MRIIVVVFFALIFFDGQAQKEKRSNSLTLFSVKDEAVSVDEFIYLYKKNHQDKNDYTQPKIEEYLKLYVNFKLKVKEARERGMDTTAAFIKEYTSYKEELKKPYLPEGKLIDSLVKVTYQRLQEEVKASHILIGVKEDALPADTLKAYNRILELKSQALKGVDFASLAALYSEEPMAQTTKGDLGYFTALQMVYPFENAAYSGKKGEVVGPVRTRFGYHILKIEDRKPARGEVEVSHIMIRTGTEHDAIKSKNLIFEIYDQLKGGVSWDELCKQYSEDQSTKNSGGKLRPFGIGTMKTVPSFERAAFSLENSGAISDPVQTQYGWHILRLERKIPLPSFEELAPTLKGRVARDERAQISKQALIKNMKKDFAFNESADVKMKVFLLADSSLTKGKWMWESSKTQPINNKTLFTLQAQPIVVLDFLKYVKQTQRLTAQAPQRYIESLYNEFVEKRINDRLEIQIIESHPDFQMLMKEYYEGILLFDIMEDEVWQKASADSLGQRKYFHAHAEAYKAGERVDVVIYYSNTMEAINSLKGLVEKGDTMNIQKAIQSKSVREEAGVFQKDDRPILSKVEWKPGLQTQENNRIYYLVHIKKLVPPGSMTFEEARVKVISDYQDNLEKEWLQLLSKKYPVRVNEKSKKHVVEKLKS